MYYLYIIQRLDFEASAIFANSALHIRTATDLSFDAIDQSNWTRSPS
jgi:hypothetical protein